MIRRLFAVVLFAGIVLLGSSNSNDASLELGLVSKSIQGLMESNDSVIIPNDIPAKTFSVTNATNFAKSSSGKAYGAGLYDTSLYLYGDVAVGVFFRNGDSVSWTPAEIDAVYSSVATQLEDIKSKLPEANLNFVLVKEKDVNGNPNPMPADERAYVNNLRETKNTNWAYMIEVFRGNSVNNRCFAVGGVCADLFGPKVTTVSNGVYAGAIAHETGHIFGILDKTQNAPSSGPTLRSGYLNVVNGNTCHNDGRGLFNGAGECASDSFYVDANLNSPYSIYSKGQAGLRDSDGDGIVDPLDTYPETTVDSKSGTQSFVYSGHAEDIALKNETTIVGGLGDVTLNTVKSVEYRINGKAWMPATPVDGNFDSAYEGFTFTTPELKDGQYTIEIRATNSVGNVETNYAVDKIVVSGSSATNIAPFPAFSVFPAYGSINTNFKFDSALSGDFETSPSGLQRRWDFNGDGTWDTGSGVSSTVYFRYSTPGVKNAILEVKDTSGVTVTTSRKVEVFATTLNPVAKFTVTPVSSYGPVALSVNFDASQSFDPETGGAVQVRWDWEGNGSWDTSYSNTLTATHSYPVPVTESTKAWNPKLEVKSGTMTAQTSREVYSVTYNSRPSLNSFSLNQTERFNFQEVGSVNYPAVSGSGGDFRYAMIKVGNYLYIGNRYSSLKVIDMTNPSVPLVVSSIPEVNVRGLFGSGNFLYVANGNLKIKNISNPNSPTHVATYITPGFASDVFVVGNYAYLADGTEGLLVVDVSNPAIPVSIGHYDVGFAEKIYVKDNFAYIINSRSDNFSFSKLNIFNISIPSSPILVSSVDMSGSAVQVRVEGVYAYILDSTNGLKIFNIADPALPSMVGSLMNSDLNLSMDIKDDKVFIGGSSLLNVIDTTDISDPETVSSYEFPSYVVALDDLSRVYAGGSLVGSSFAPIKVFNLIPYIENSISFLAQDSNSNTNWDGLLEYRCDLNKDGFWDNKFSISNPLIYNLSGASADQFVCETRDRFDARSQKTKSLICSDGTPVGQCSGLKYCTENGFVTNQCQQCGCSKGQICKKTGSGYQCQIGTDGTNPDS